MLVDQHGVGERPQMLSWLEFGGVGQQEQQVDMFGHPHSRTVMPVGTVQHQHNLFGWTRPDLMGEGFQLHREELDIDHRCQMPHHAPGGGMHKTDEVAPRIPMLDWSERLLGTLAGDSRQRSGLLENRLEPDAMPIDGPQLDGRQWKGRCHLPKQRTQMLLEVGLSHRVSSHVARPWL